jgi:hypothetical protein
MDSIESHDVVTMHRPDSRSAISASTAPPVRLPCSGRAAAARTNRLSLLSRVSERLANYEQQTNQDVRYAEELKAAADDLLSRLEQ